MEKMEKVSELPWTSEEDEAQWHDDSDSDPGWSEASSECDRSSDKKKKIAGARGDIFHVAQGRGDLAQP